MFLLCFSYYDVNWIDKFQLTRPFHKGEIKDKSNEFAVRMFNIYALTLHIYAPSKIFDIGFEIVWFIKSTISAYYEEEKDI